jgi:hypothetical protein
MGAGGATNGAGSGRSVMALFAALVTTSGELDVGNTGDTTSQRGAPKAGSFALISLSLARSVISVRPTADGESPV